MRVAVVVVCIVSFCGVAAGELSAPEFSNRTVDLKVSDSDFSDYVVLSAESPQDGKEQVSEAASGTVHVTQRSVGDSSEDNRISSDDIEVYSTDDTDTVEFKSILENGSVRVSGGFDENDSINYTAARTVNLTEQSSSEFSGSSEIAEADAPGGLRASSGEELSFSYFNGSERVSNSTVLDTQPPEFSGARQVSERNVVLEFSESVSGPSDGIAPSAVVFPELTAVSDSVSVSESSDSFTVEVRLNSSISTGRQPLTNFSSELEDAAGNSATGAAVTASDRAPPQPTAIYSRDRDFNGRLDTVELVTSEQLESTASLGGVFQASIDRASINIEGSSLDGNQVRLELDENSVWTGAVNVEYSPGQLSPIEDREGNEMQDIGRESLDRAPPVLLGAIINTSESSESKTVINLVFSEETEAEGKGPSATLDGEAETVTASDGRVEAVVDGSLELESRHSVSEVTGVNDGNGNSVRVADVQVRVFPDSSRTGERVEPVFLEEGWNLVSLPIGTGSRLQLSDAFTDLSRIESIWRYTDDEWSLTVPGSGVEEFRYMRGGVGYAVKAESRTEFQPILSSATNAPGSTETGQHWMLAGPTEPYRQEPSGTGAFQHINDVNRVLKLQNNQISQTESFETNTAPGSGYWVDVSGGSPTGSFAISSSLERALRWLMP
jgi:hypothetical protein